MLKKKEEKPKDSTNRSNKGNQKKQDIKSTHKNQLYLYTYEQ